MDTAGTLAAAAWALLAAWWAPGSLLVGRAAFGRDGLERFVLAWSLGRAVFAAVSLLAVST
ncbi:MAG: hypothetical protein HKP30_03250, partial [Myxococcales bacterium]|nr:hypothetical protein [Myxococcales bacterium]